TYPGTLPDENVNETVDFSFEQEEDEPILGAIGNYVWIDENSDGFQDAGEPGIPNVAMILKDENGDSIDTTYTDSQGGYLFPNLPEGDYFVDVDETTLPNSALSQTTIFTNEIDADDDDIVEDDGDFGNKNHIDNGYAITLDPGEENLTADFGYNYNPTVDVNDPTDAMASPLAALGDRVWIDSDSDGAQDLNEIGVSGVEITLTGAGLDGEFGTADDIMDVTTTDDNGYYLFDDLVPGAYMTEVTDDNGASHDILTPSDYEQTGDPDHFGISEAENPDDSVEDDNKQTKPIVLGPGDVYLNSDYGYVPTPTNMELGSVGNTVWLDADADGNAPSAVNGDPVNGNGGQNDSDEQPISGVSVTLIKDINQNGIWDVGEPIIGTDITDMNGQYLFDDLPLDDGDGDADYIVWVNDTDNVLQGLEATYDADGDGDGTATGLGDDAMDFFGISAAMISPSNPDAINQDFGYTPEDNEPGTTGFIGDYVWYDTDASGDDEPDVDEVGIEGVVLELFDDMNNLIATTTTDENGYYLFGGLPVDADGEDYQVVVASSNFDSGSVLEGLINTYDPDGTTPVNTGELVTLTIDNLFTNINENGDLDQDFSYVADPNNDGSLGNKVWLDVNANGIRDAGEEGINGVTIDLYRDLNGNDELDPGEPKIGTTTTSNAVTSNNLSGEDGMYLFDNLPLDDYIVDVTDENGELVGYWHSTGEQDPTTSSGDDPMDNSKDDAFAVTIDGTISDNFNVDFGYYKDPAALGNFVWMDSNSDGIQDDGEMGIDGVDVTMMIEYPDATMVTLVTTTVTKDGKMGYYEFPNLLLDEDYSIGSGSAEADPMGGTTMVNRPRYTIKVITTDQDGSGQVLDGKVPTVSDVNGAGLQPSDAEEIAGVNAVPVQGSQNTSPAIDETTEANEAQYDFGFTTDLVGIGGTVWEDQGAGGGTQNDGTQDGAEQGVGGVVVELLFDANTDGIIDGMELTTPLRSRTTNPDGTYLFEALQPGKYQIRIPASNFSGGGALMNLPFSSVPTTTTDDDDTDNDDNGINGAIASSEILSPIYMLMVGDEPSATDETLTPTQDGSDSSTRDGSTNTTVDFGFQDEILPVEFLDFSAKADKDHIDLTWATASEFENSHFELERSEDGKVFKKIARIQGQGTTLLRTDYKHEDHEAIPNILYYYRIKQVDFDGSFAYTEIRTAELDAITEWQLYPNPIGQDKLLNVNFYAQETTVAFVILDAQNRSILNIKQDLSSTGWQQIQIDINALPAGTYILMDAEGNTKRFVVAME
ncbi:MAG: SdrD B-like domain-containing protein, partial [Bacteroidota bacterium]